MTTVLMDAYKDALKKQKNCNEPFDSVTETIKLMKKLAELGRTEGLLALDLVGEMLERGIVSAAELAWEEGLRKRIDAIFASVDFRLLPNVKQMVAILLEQVMNGTDPEDIEKIGADRYYKDEPEGRQALCVILAIVGIVFVQAAETPQVLEEKLINFLPKELE